MLLAFISLGNDVLFDCGTQIANAIRGNNKFMSKACFQLRFNISIAGTMIDELNAAANPMVSAYNPVRLAALFGNSFFNTPGRITLAMAMPIPINNVPTYRPEVLKFERINIPVVIINNVMDKVRYSPNFNDIQDDIGENKENASRGNVCIIPAWIDVI